MNRDETMKKTIKVTIIFLSIIVIIVLTFVGYRQYTLYPSGWGKVVREAKKENPHIADITCKAYRGITCRIGVYMNKNTTPDDVDTAFTWLREKVFTEEINRILCDHYSKIVNKIDNIHLRIYIDFSYGGEYKYAFEAPVYEGSPWTVKFVGESDIFGYGGYVYTGSLTETMEEAVAG